MWRGEVSEVHDDQHGEEESFAGFAKAIPLPHRVAPRKIPDDYVEPLLDSEVYASANMAPAQVFKDFVPFPGPVPLPPAKTFGRDTKISVTFDRVTGDVLGIHSVPKESEDFDWLGWEL